MELIVLAAVSVSAGYWAFRGVYRRRRNPAWLRTQFPDGMQNDLATTVTRTPTAAVVTRYTSPGWAWMMAEHTFDGVVTTTGWCLTKTAVNVRVNRAAAAAHRRATGP